MSEFIFNSNSTLNSSTIRPKISMSKLMPYEEQILIDAFNTYVQIGVGSVLFVSGLTFNCLSLVYFYVSRSFRNTTFRLYFSIISILDIIRLFEFLIFVFFDKGYLRVTLNLCRSVFFTIMFTGQASIWLTVALAVEKCLIIWFPIKGRLLFTLSISKLTLVLMLCVVFSADLIYLLPGFFLKAYENLSIHTFMCVWQSDTLSSVNTYERWKKHYFIFNTIFFHSIIPSILLLVLNGLILCSLSRQQVVLTKICLLVLSSFFVIITISPRYVLTMVYAFANDVRKAPIMPLHIYVNLNTVFRVLEMCNYSLNIIVAIISGRTSRLEIRKLMHECLLSRLQRTRTRHRRDIKLTRRNSTLFDDEEEEETDRSLHMRKRRCHRTVVNRPFANDISSSSKTITSNHLKHEISDSRPSLSNWKVPEPNQVVSSLSISKDRIYSLTKSESYELRSLMEPDTKSRHNSICCQTVSRPQNIMVVNCLYCKPSTRMPTAVRKSSISCTKQNVNMNGTSSEENICLTTDRLLSNTGLSLTSTERFTSVSVLVKSSNFVESDTDEPLSPAYIIETC